MLTFFFHFLVALGIKPRTLNILSKHPIVGLDDAWGIRRETGAGLKQNWIARMKFTKRYFERKPRSRTYQGLMNPVRSHTKQEVCFET